MAPSLTSPLEMPALTERVLDRTLHPGLLARLEARIRAGALDEALAAGADPASSPALAHRARAITSRRVRRGLSRALEELVARADGRSRRRLRVPPARPAIRDHRELLEDLAATLRETEPVYSRGVALLLALLRDGTGPAYVAGGSDELGRHLRAARSALRG
jgi:hypothetical protein